MSKCIYQFPLTQKSTTFVQEIVADAMPAEWFSRIRSAEQKYLVGIERETDLSRIHTKMRGFHTQFLDMPYRGLDSYIAYALLDDETQLNLRDAYQTYTFGRNNLSELCADKMIGCNAQCLLLKYGLVDGKSWDIYFSHKEDGGKTVHTELLRKHPLGFLRIDITRQLLHALNNTDEYVVLEDEKRLRYVDQPLLLSD